MVRLIHSHEDSLRPNRTPRRWLTWTLIVLPGLVLMASVSVLMALTVFREPLKQAALDALQRRMQAEVLIQGPVRVSLLRHFPFASVSFHDVTVGKAGYADYPLLTCRELGLLFRPWDLFRQQRTIRQLSFRNSIFTWYQTPDGNNLPHPGAPDTSDTRFAWTISEAVLTDTRIILIHHADSLRLQLYAPHLLLTARQEYDTLGLHVQGLVKQTEAAYHQKHRHWSLPIQLKAALTYSAAADFLLLRELDVRLNDLPLKARGVVRFRPQGPDYTLQCSSNPFRLDQLLEVLGMPQSFFHRLKHADGSVQFAMLVTGASGAAPVVQAALQVEDGLIVLKNPECSITRIRAAARFNNANKSPAIAQLHVSPLDFYTNGKPFSAYLQLFNGPQPRLSATVKGTLDLPLAAAWLTGNPQPFSNGTIEFSPMRLQARLSENFSLNSPDALTLRGRVALNQAVINTTYGPLTIERSDMQVEENQLQLIEARCRLGDSDATLSGTFRNLNTLFVQAPGLQKPAAPLQADIALQSSRMDFSATALTKTSQSSTAGDSAFLTIQRLSNRLNGRIACRIDHLVWRRMKLEHLLADIQLGPNILLLKDAAFSHAGGQVQVTGHLTFADLNSIALLLHADGKHLNIRDVFEQHQNFGQAYLTAQHVSGQVSGRLYLTGYWKNGKWNDSLLQAQASLTVQQGELKYFKPLEALSRFIKLEELRHLRFRTLSNTLLIRNRTIYIPEMDVICNALNIHAGGTYTFDHEVNYRIQLNLLRLLTNRLRPTDYDADAGEETTQGALNLFLTMTGDALNPELRYDKNRVKQKIAADLRAEQQEVRSLLRQEFGRQPPASPTIPEPADVEFFEFADEDSTAH